LTGSKICPDCARDLPRTEFGTRVAASGNTVSKPYCRQCERVRARKSYDSAAARALYLQRRAEDPERFQRYARDSRERLRGSVARAERARRWRESNAERVKEYRRTYATENRAIRAAWERGRTAKKKQLTVVPFTKAQLAERWSMFTGCWMCGGPKETADHVKPLSAGGAHMLANLRPACLSCNSRKRCRWPFSVEMLNGTPSNH